ncbi:MAG TPA: hypothetical protein VK796_03800, partial [Cytophaga sp.]|nr:hypothetical protein [Cytophaga sp.]
MNKIAILTLFFFAYLTGFGQTDTIFSKNKKISCKVLKVKTDSISYRLIESDIPYAISKKEVDKIIYKNGKTFSIKDDIRIVHVDGISNFNDVVITFTAADTARCTKIEDIEVHFEHDQSGQSKYLEKTYAQLKIHAALRGANIVYVPEQKALSINGVDDNSITDFYGIAYCSKVPTLDEFDKKIGEKTEFNATEQWYLPKGRTDVYQLYFNGKFIINEITEFEGFVYINGELKGFPKINSFRLISVSAKFFTVSFEMNNNVYNV